MIEPHADRPQAVTLGADKAYDAEDFVNELRSMKVTPHVAQNTSGRSSRSMAARRAILATPSVSAPASESKKRLMVAELEQTKFRECDRVGWALRFATAAEAVGAVGMSSPPNCQLNHWRRYKRAGRRRPVIDPYASLHRLSELR